MHAIDKDELAGKDVRVYLHTSYLTYTTAMF